MAVKPKKSLTVRLGIGGVRETLKSFGDLDDEASKQLRERSRDLADSLASSAQAAGTAMGAQAALVARTVKAQRDRVPVVVAGGTRKLGRHRVPAWQLLFAAEFGMNQPSGWYKHVKYRDSTGSQYPPHRGQKGYWFAPTVEREESRIDREWNAAASEIMAAFTRGGGV